MKKINITLVMLLALVLVFTGCRGEGGVDTTAPPTVTESPAVTTSPETTAEETTSVPETTECKHYSYVTEEITASCADEKAFAESHCIVCGYSWSVPVPPPAHNYVDGVCKGCGDTLWSDGLEFRTSADYAVVIGIGTCEDNEVIIPATYNGLPVTEIWDRAFYQVEGMNSVTIPEGVTYIESEAFLNCPDLREIHLPASLENVTGSLSIGFMNCPALEIIDVAEGNAKYIAKNNCLIEKSTGKLVLGGGKAEIPADGSVKSIGAHAFAGNLLLRSLNIPDGVTDIHTSAFEGCTTLASVTLPKTLKTVRQSAFKGCTALTAIVIPDSVTEIYNAAFSDCKNLKDVTLSKNLTHIDSEAFKACAIESIEIPAGVKELGAAFSECDKLKSVTLPEGFEHFVGHTFAGCTALESINMPASLKYIGMYTFKDCTALKELRFGGTVSEWNAVYKQESWNDDAAFVSVKCSDGEVKLYADAADGASPGLEYKIDGYGAVLVSIGNCTDKDIVIAPTFGGMAVTRIDSSAFSGCDFIESVVIPEGVTVISNEAFYLCKNLKKVTLPSTLDIIGSWAFANCEKLEKVAIPNGIMIIEQRAFSDCAKLSTLTLGEGLEQIQENAFMNCASLKSVRFPRGLKLLAAASFDGCTKLANVSYGGSTNEWSHIGKEGAEWNSEWYRGIPATKVSCTDGEVSLSELTEADAIEAARKFWALPSNAVLIAKERSPSHPDCYKIAYCEPSPIDFAVKREVFVDQSTGECKEVVYDYPNVPDVFLDVIFNREKFLYVEQTPSASGEYTYTTSEALFMDLSIHGDNVLGLQTLWYHVIDIDGDSTPELVFPGMARSNYGILLRAYEGKIYGYACILDCLHTDATYLWYEQAGNYAGRSQVYFDGIFYKSRRLTECDINDPNNIIYYIEGKETTKEKYEEFESAFSNDELEAFKLDYYPVYVNPFPGG